MFHINPKSGAVGSCRAEKGRCPFGPENEHFTTAAEARKHYEKKMSEEHPLDRSTLKSLTAEELHEVLVIEAGEISLETPVIEQAATFARELHEGQFRSAPPWEARPPYITHPLRNSIRLIRWGCKDQVTIVAAILHDTVEDSSEKYCRDRGIPYKDEEDARRVLLAEIERVYGSDVAHVVHKLSNEVSDPKVRARMTDTEKIEEYVGHVSHSISNDHRVFLAKLADFHDNAASLIHTLYPGREKQTQKQANKYWHTMPEFRKALIANPFSDPVIRNSVHASITLIEDRLKAILGLEKFVR